MDAVRTLQDTIAGAAEAVGPSVVGLGRGWGHGSGVVIADGQVLTCAHNLRREETTVTFADGRRETGTVAGVDSDLDLAVVAVDTGDAPPVGWEPAAGESGSGSSEAASASDSAPSGSSASGSAATGSSASAPGSAATGSSGSAPGALGIGSPVVALANPGGRGLRVTLGFVSSGARSFRGPRGRRIRGAIEHTAPLPRGSSGGPLVDPDGNLLGVNSLRLDGGLILAVPADAAVKERILRLARGEASAPHRLGVAIAPPRVARRLRTAVGLPERDGLLVRAVEDGGAADGAGIEKGDLIVAAGGTATENVEALYTALDSVPAAGGDLELTLVRGTDERTVTASFGGEQAA
jgi:S1-C subfamily serine protease